MIHSQSSITPAYCGVISLPVSFKIPNNSPFVAFAQYIQYCTVIVSKLEKLCTFNNSYALLPLSF